MHKTTNELTPNRKSVAFKKVHDLTAAKAGILRVQRVNMLHEFLFILTLLLVFGVLVIDI